MLYLIWSEYTRLAKEIASAAIYGASIERTTARERQHLQRDLSHAPRLAGKPGHALGEIGRQQAGEFLGPVRQERRHGRRQMNRQGFGLDREDRHRVDVVIRRWAGLHGSRWNAEPGIRGHDRHPRGKLRKALSVDPRHPHEVVEVFEGTVLVSVQDDASGQNVANSR